MVTPSDSANQRGPARRAAIGVASSASPSDAPTDSWNPTLLGSIGSTSTSPATARERIRSRDAGRPENAAQHASAAIADARRTDGSARVMTAKNAMTASDTTKRPRRPRRRSNGPVTATTKARFSPDTASRCVSPAAGSRPRSGAASSRSSPRRKPLSSDRRSSGIEAVPPHEHPAQPVRGRVAAEPAASRPLDRRPGAPRCGAPPAGRVRRRAARAGGPRRRRPRPPAGPAARRPAIRVPTPRCGAHPSGGRRGSRARRRLDRSRARPRPARAPPVVRARPTPRAETTPRGRRPRGHEQRRATARRRRRRGRRRAHRGTGVGTSAPSHTAMARMTVAPSDTAPPADGQAAGEARSQHTGCDAEPGWACTGLWWHPPSRRTPCCASVECCARSGLGDGSSAR